MSLETREIYEFGDHRLDVERRLVLCRGEPVALPPKTFELLLFFVRHPGRAFSKRELMATLWPETFVEEANLSFQISALRKALGDGAAGWIETIPKHGYRFSEDVRTISPASSGEPESRSGNRVTGRHRSPGPNRLALDRPGSERGRGRADLDLRDRQRALGTAAEPARHTGTRRAPHQL